MTLIEMKKRIDEIYEQALDCEYKPEDIDIVVEDDDGNCLEYLHHISYEKDYDIIVLAR